MRLWFAGGEVAAWRALLRDQGADDVAMSFVGLARKVKFTRPWLIEEHFDTHQRVLLDSGAYTLNHSAAGPMGQELTELVGKYETFVQENIGRVDFAIEMDALALGPAMLRNHRDTLRDIAGDKAVVVWHPEDGLHELMLLAERYPNIALGVVELEGRDLIPTLTSLARSGTRLFGMAMTKPAAMHAVPWYSVHSTSWLSPSQYGDTIIWARGELKRYHSRQKDAARRRHRSDIAAAGFDPDLIAQDDRNEVLKLSLWSWRQQLAAVNRVTTSPAVAHPQNAENTGDEVDHPTPDTRNALTTPGPRARPTEPLPGLSTQLVEHITKDPESGAREVTQIPVLRSAGGGQMACDTCYVQHVCPKFEAGAACAFEVNIEVRTEAQIDALLQMLIEHETRDYLREDFEAQLTGGGDRTRAARSRSNISRLIKLRQDLHETGFTLKITGRGGGSGTEPGFISRIFGQQPAAIAPSPPAPTAYEQFGMPEVQDADWVAEEAE